MKLVPILLSIFVVFSPTLAKNSFDSHAKAKAILVKKAALHALKTKNYSRQLPIVRNYDWAVVGGGLAGILAVGILAENGVPLSSIAWIDDTFKVGALGNYFQNVPGNLSTKQWISAIENCDYLKQCPSNPIKHLKRYDLDLFYPLSIIVKPMQDITNWLLTKANGFKNNVININSEGNDWNLKLSNFDVIKAHKVILATGSHPKSLNYKFNQEIPLPVALDKQKLAQAIKPDDTVAVIGSSHSAAIALMLLAELPVKNVVHFYTHPFSYTQQTEKGVINAESGLKGPAAKFAKEVIEANKMHNLNQIFNTKQNRDAWLPHCTKIIYATGFTPNSIPLKQGNPLHYDDTTGIIQRNLFGFGIAFPGKKADANGKMEHRVGMPHFLEYGKRVIPQWIAMA